MRRLVVLPLLLCAALLLPGCKLLDALADKYESPEERYERMLEAIVAGDEEELRGFFSQKAIAEAEDFEGNMQRLLSLIEGDVVAFEKGATSRGSSTDGVVVHRRWYELTTTGDVYDFFILDYEHDNKDPDNKGFYALRVCRQELHAAHFGTWQDMNVPGIYCPREYNEEIAALDAERRGMFHLFHRAGLWPVAAEQSDDESGTSTAVQGAPSDFRLHPENYTLYRVTCEDGSVYGLLWNEKWFNSLICHWQGELIMYT